MIEQEVKDALGKNIKFFRFRRQFSQADLAEKADISVTFLSNIERGNNFPQAGTLCNLAQALDVEVWELFRGAGPSYDQNSIIDRISEDFAKYVNFAMETVHKQYKA
jgi:transcriptional regulator with XRE-family HTH domain